MGILFAFYMKRETPVITETYEPERFTLKLKLNFTCQESGDDKVLNSKSDIQKNIILNYLKEKENGKISDFEKLLGVKTTRVKHLIYELIESKTIIAVGSNRNRTYHLNQTD